MRQSDQQLVYDCIGRYLARAGYAQYDATRRLAEYEFDSVARLELVLSLEQVLNIRLKDSLVTEHRGSINDLVVKVLDLKQGTSGTG